MLEVKIQVKGLKNLMERIRKIEKVPKLVDEVINQAVRRSADIIEREVLMRTPVRTGRLLESIKVRKGWKWVTVGTDIEYAAYIEEGVRPHVILPRVKEALYWEGAPHPVRKVLHPGIRPRKFMEGGFLASLPKIEKEFDKALRKVVNQVTS